MTLELGHRADVTRTFQASDAGDFADISGLQGQVDGTVPEPLIAAMFSYLLGVKLPGFGTNYLKQEMRFSGRAAYGMPLTASVEVTRLRPEKDLVDLETICRRPDGTEICRGRALVFAKDVGKS